MITRAPALAAYISFSSRTLLSRAGARNLKTREKIETAINKILVKTRAQRWVFADIKEIENTVRRQSSPGRPGKNTRYRNVIHVSFRLTPRLHQENVDYDARIDGLFPLVTNLKDTPIHQVFAKYKYQPTLENRHRFLKNSLEVAPMNLKSPARIEALLFLYFLAQLVHALIEREVRQYMDTHGIVQLPLHPELRPVANPTSTRIFETFGSLRRHRLFENGELMETFWDHLDPIQRKVLKMLQISTQHFEQ